MHNESAYDGWTAYCYPEQGMVDRLLRVHIQSQRAFGTWWTLIYNIPSAIAEVFSPPIPRMWGATPVAAEVGCGTGVRVVSRRVASANVERRGASRKLCTTLMASCTVMSSACEKTTTLLSRCLAETGTAAAQEWVATWPRLL